MDKKEVLIQRDPKDPTLLTPAIPITEEEAKKLPPDQVIRVEDGNMKVFSMPDKLPEADQKGLSDQMLIRKLTKQRNEFETLWHEARALGGKMYWDGAQHGYVWGLNGQAGYGIDKRICETARDVSIVIHNGRHRPLTDDQELLDRLEPLTFVVIKYNTDDQILFQYVAGEPKVIRIKTHDGWTCEPNKPLAKNLQTNIFKSIP